MKTLIIFIIRLYQKTLSPDHGWFKARYPYGFCRFYPSCSEYGIETVQKFGAATGLLKTFLRVLRCNPWAQPRVDHTH